jgi:hypothetical protein
VGEARAVHADSELEGALFQVASQFNLLEMTGPTVTLKDGVTLDSCRRSAPGRIAALPRRAARTRRY